MEKIYFSNYSDLSSIPYVGRVAVIQEPGYMNLNRLDNNGLHTRELKFRYLAATTGDTIYYQKLLEVQKELRENALAHAEILEKYPYDGKSTFAELLEKAKLPANFFVWRGM